MTAEAIRNALEDFGVWNCTNIQVVREKYWLQRAVKPDHCSVFLDFATRFKPQNLKPYINP